MLAGVLEWMEKSLNDGGWGGGGGYELKQPKVWEEKSQRLSWPCSPSCTPPLPLLTHPNAVSTEPSAVYLQKQCSNAYFLFYMYHHSLRAKTHSCHTHDPDIGQVLGTQQWIK